MSKKQKEVMRILIGVVQSLMSIVAEKQISCVITTYWTYHYNNVNRQAHRSTNL